MKKFKSLVAIILMSVLLIGYSTFFSNKSQAYTADDIDNVFVIASDEYEFNRTEIMHINANNSTGRVQFLNYRHSADDDELYEIYNYVDCDDINTEKKEGKSPWSDNLIDASDSSNILVISQVDGNYYEDETKESAQDSWQGGVNRLMFSVADNMKIDREKVHIEVTVRTPAVEEYGVEEDSLVITDKTGINDEIWEKLIALDQQNERVYNEAGFTGFSEKVILQLVSVKVTTEDGDTFRLLVADDNNFYFQKEKEPIVVEEPEFETVMEYSSYANGGSVEGKMSDDGTIYLAPYYDNDNNTKDADVTVTIKSKTNEEIVAVVVDGSEVELTADRKPNSLGWYYPDVENKKVIAKEYPFDKYDTTTYNGEVSETVKLIGSLGGEDTQKPHVKWTFRRKVKYVNEEKDKVTVTIVYNLPVDKDSIPSDWSPVYDEDGKTIHRIEKVINKGENYKKDVTVKQNGNTATVTTPVEKVWELPKTGDIWSFAVVVAIILGVFGITRYNKVKKYSKIK